LYDTRLTVSYLLQDLKLGKGRQDSQGWEKDKYYVLFPSFLGQVI